MIDSNAIANLQMLMNTGDGRHAVLAELLDVPLTSSTPIRGLMGGTFNRRESRDPLRSHSLKPVIRGKNGRHLRLLQRAPQEAGEEANLSGNIITLLDNLTPEKKAPLTTFSEGLAHHYNNLLMAIMGYISIAMPHFKSGHPARKKLRDCEEHIHNAAMLIRLLVDVFQRSDQRNKTLYPIDICDREIGARIFSASENHPFIKTSQDMELAPRIILQHIAASMATRLLLLMRTLEKEVARALASQQTPKCIRSYRRRIGSYIRRGVNTATRLQEFSGRLNLNRTSADMAALLNEAIIIFQSCFACMPIRIEVPHCEFEISVDRDLLRKALIELIFNAYLLVPAGGELSIRLETIELERDDRSRNGQLQLLLTHPVGEGFKDDQARQLFDPFMRPPDSGFAHRGLGLASASGIIRCHGGHIACCLVGGLLRTTLTLDQKR